MSESKTKETKIIAREGFDRRLRQLIRRRQRATAVAAAAESEFMDLGPPICQNGPLISDQPAWFQKTVTPVEHPKQTYPIETQHPMFLEKLRGEGKGAQVRMRGRDGRFQPGWRNFHRTTNPPGANRLTKFN